MVTCLECGVSVARLQWTHFKFNCTGKFANCKEYKTAYPDAETVSIAVDIRHRDMLKLQTAKDFGFKTLVVWESEFKANKHEIIKKVVQWILKEQQ